MGYKCPDCEQYFDDRDQAMTHYKLSGHNEKALNDNSMSFAIGGYAGVGVSKLFKRLRK
jgi:hypothetical protein